MDKVRELQRQLFKAAKRHRGRRFHALYDRICRGDVLAEAWKRVRANRGAAGVDGETLSSIEAHGVAEFLRDLGEELKQGKYRPRPVRRQYIPKSDGRQRPLGIPAVRDRVVQTAAKLVLEPIFEADFHECSYGFRPRRSATQAKEAIRMTGGRGHYWVVDADIRSFFDTIDQGVLMERLQRRISDRRVLKLLRKWLRAGVMEEGKVKKATSGTPQGGVISPLLANVYLEALDETWERDCRHLGRLVRYADDCAPRRRERRANDLAILKQPCCTRDEGRPLGAGLQERASNHLELRGSRARVVSVVGKGGARLRQVRIEKTSASEPPMTCRKRRDDVKTGGSRYSGISLGATCLLPSRRPALRRRDLGSGSRAERGNLSPRCEGRIPSGRPTRKRVPMRGTGAELRVVVGKVL